MRYLIIVFFAFIASCSNETKKKDVVFKKPDIDSINKREELSLIKKYNAAREWSYNFTVAMRDILIDSLIGTVGFINDIDRVEGVYTIQIPSSRPSYIANISITEDQMATLIKDIPRQEKRYKGCFIFKLEGIINKLSREEKKRILYGPLVDYYIYKRDE